MQGLCQQIEFAAHTLKCILHAQMTTLDSAAAEGQLEAELRLAFEAKREALLPGADMCWDAPLSFLLMPLLVAYEQVSDASCADQKAFDNLRGQLLQ